MTTTHDTPPPPSRPSLGRCRPAPGRPRHITRTDLIRRLLSRSILERIPHGTGHGPVRHRFEPITQPTTVALLAGDPAAHDRLVCRSVAEHLVAEDLGVDVDGLAMVPGPSVATRIDATVDVLARMGRRQVLALVEQVFVARLAAPAEVAS